MTITIDLPEETVTNLREWAQTQGRPAAQIAAEVVMERFGANHDAEEFLLDDDALEKLRRGFADIDAGRTVSLEESRTRIEALLAARHGNGSG